MGSPVEAGMGIRGFRVWSEEHLSLLPGDMCVAQSAIESSHQGGLSACGERQFPWGAHLVAAVKNLLTTPGIGQFRTWLVSRRTTLLPDSSTTASPKHG